MKQVTERLVDLYRGQAIDLVVGIESRGFIFAPTVACELGAGFVPVRKPGKLPAEAIVETYDLEYGQDSLEVHRDAIREGQRVLLVDDLLATGGTAAATVRLVRRLGGQVGGRGLPGGAGVPQRPRPPARCRGPIPAALPGVVLYRLLADPARAFSIPLVDNFFELFAILALRGRSSRRRARSSAFFNIWCDLAKHAV